MNHTTDTSTHSAAPSLWSRFSALAGAAIGLKAKEAMTPADKADLMRSIDEVKAAGIQVREVKINGPQLVVIITDIHNAEFQEEIVARIPIVYETLKLQLLGLEGWLPGEITGGPDQFVRKQISDILNRDVERRVLETEAQDHGFKEGCLIIPTAATKPFVKDSRFACVGLEGEAFPELDRQLLIFVRERLDEMHEQLRSNGLVVIGIENKLLHWFHAFDNAQSYLSSKYTDFPLLDLNNFPLVQREGKKTRYPAMLKDMSESVIESVIKLVEYFELKHCCGPRSVKAVEIIEAEMLARRFTRAGVVFGLAHSINIGRRHQSIQDHLDKKNISYIVIDPIPVTIERKGKNICFILPISPDEFETRRKQLQ